MFAGSSISLQFIEIISDTWQNIVCAIKLAKSFITLNSFKSVRYKVAVEMCSDRPCISYSQSKAERWQYVERGYLTLPQMNSLG